MSDDRVKELKAKIEKLGDQDSRLEGIRQILLMIAQELLVTQPVQPNMVQRTLVVLQAVEDLRVAFQNECDELETAKRFMPTRPPIQALKNYDKF